MRPSHPCFVCNHATIGECETYRGGIRPHGLMQCPSCGCLCMEGRAGTGPGIDVVTMRDRTNLPPPSGPIRGS